MSNNFEDYRHLLFAIAYRMLGSAMEAEDMVQEAWLRYQAVSPETIESPKAFLTTIVTRLCLDQLKSAKAQRETYIGPWLPEPVLTGNDGTFLSSPDTQVGEYESISMAFLVLLESLTPVERAVFLLREVFDYDYAEIARIVNREEAACRQLFSRARKHIADHRPRFEPSPEAHEKIVSEFLQVAEAGDMNGLMHLLAEDVTWWSDGGGKVHSATRPIHGREAVLRFIAGLMRLRPDDASNERIEVNGQTAILLRYDGKVRGIFTFETDVQHITAIRAVNNPDKLSRLSL